MPHDPHIDDDLLREILADAYPESEIERLTIQEGWTLRDFESRLRDDGFLEDVGTDYPDPPGQIVYHNGERYEM